jgi:hypothetical protein
VQHKTIITSACEPVFQLKTVREARFDSSNARFLVKGLLPARGLSLWCGDRLASLLALHFGYAIAQGEDRTIFGRRIEVAGVLYAALGDETELERRIRAHCLRYGEAAKLRYLASSARLLTRDDAVPSLIRALQQSGSGLLIIDNLDSLLSTGQIETLMIGQRIHDIEAGANVHIALVTSQSAQRAKTLLEQMGAEAARIFDIQSARNGYRLVCDSLTGPASRGLAAFRPDEIELGYDAEGDVVTSFVVREGTAPTPSLRTKLSARQAQLLEAVESAIRLLGENMTLADGIARPTISKIELRRHLLAQGLLKDDFSDGSRRISRNQHNKIWKQLNALEDKGFLGHDREQVWLFPSLDHRKAKQEATHHVA